MCEEICERRPFKLGAQTATGAETCACIKINAHKHEGATLGRSFILNGMSHDLVLFGRKSVRRRVGQVSRFFC